MRGSPGHQGKREIYEALKAQILAGGYSEGSLLPSSRALAAELGVARTTVSAAYDQLIAEGFVSARRGARLRVTLSSQFSQGQNTVRPEQPFASISAFGLAAMATPAAAAQPGLSLKVDFHYGSLSASDFPLLQWKRAVNSVLLQKKLVTRYSEPEGSLRLRKALQAYLWRSRSLTCDLEQIIVVNGSQQGIDLCSRILLDPGGAFAIEDPCYAIARHTLKASGANCIPISADEEGLKTQDLLHIDARLVFTTPSHQYPLGGVMPVTRRQELLNWAEHGNAYVLEDDYDSEHRYDVQPLPPLHTLDGGNRVIYLGTASKTLAPGLRLGYLVVPHALAAVFRKAKHLTDRHAPLMDQEALAEMIESGAYERHIRRQRRRNGLRRAALISALEAEFGSAVRVQGADAGLHILAWLKGFPARMEHDLISEAARTGVGVYALSPHYAQPLSTEYKKEAGLILGYGALEPDEIRDGIKRLGKAVRSLSMNRNL